MKRSFDAIVLCGGEGKRLGGVDKAALEIDGETFLERSLRAVEGAEVTICVGPRRPTSREVVWTREEPAGGGPVAALAAGLEHVTAPVVVVLSVDAPFLTAQIVGELVAATDDRPAVLVDGDGVPQPLIAAYPSTIVRSRIAPVDANGMSVRDVLSGIDVHTLRDPEASRDVDTQDDLAALHGEGG